MPSPFVLIFFPLSEPIGDVHKWTFGRIASGEVWLCWGECRSIPARCVRLASSVTSLSLDFHFFKWKSKNNNSYSLVVGKVEGDRAGEK